MAFAHRDETGSGGTFSTLKLRVRGQPARRGQGANQDRYPPSLWVWMLLILTDNCFWRARSQPHVLLGIRIAADAPEPSSALANTY